MITGTDHDPIHMVPRTGVAWSRVNLSEALPGVLTPLGWTFWANATETATRVTFWRLGVLPRSGLKPAVGIDDRFIGVFFGRAAANVDWIHDKIVRLPGGRPEAFELQYLGAVRPDVDHSLVRGRYPFVAVKLPLAAFANPVRVRRVRRQTDVWWRRSITNVATDPRRLFSQAYDRFAVVLAEHGLATILAQAVYEQVARLASEAGHAGLETSLCSGWGPTEETTLVTDIWRAARTGAGIEPLLSAHGYHGPDEGELSSRPWRENPEPLVALVDRYRELDGSASPTTATERRSRERRAAEATLLGALTPVNRAKAKILLRAARTYVPQREVGKAAFLQALDVGRAAARAHGMKLARAKLLDDPEDVFYLTAREVIDDLPPEVKALVGDRRRKREEYKSLEVPNCWVGPAIPGSQPNPQQVASDAPPDSTSTSIQGLGVSPGIAKGSARVITGAEGIFQLEPGEVLVCPTTDPSWAPAMLLAAALVIDVGGALSHGAIVARELGVPCVINTGTGTARLRTGDLLEVDGTSGRVQITRSPGSAAAS